MTIPPEGQSDTKPQLVRGISLGSATALNMIDMIGVGPFITIPLIVSAMGGPQAMLGWVLGAVLAICDGLVWAELGAAMPGSGGSYRYLKEIYGPQKLGRAGLVPLYLATLLQRSAFDCLGSRGAFAVRSFLLAALWNLYGRPTPGRCISLSLELCN